MLKENTIHLGDCLDLMPSIPSKSIDMILCDLPYGTTESKWDSIIDMSKLWQEYERIIKDNGIICLTAQGVFCADLISYKRKWFNHDYVWVKNQHSNFALAGIQPFRIFENICIFKKPNGGKNTFNFDDRIKSISTKKKNAFANVMYGNETRKQARQHKEYISKEYENYPRNVLYFDCERGQHPTQKPVALFEYLIRTYTNEGELILDNCSGSGTTAIACMNTNRRFICIERDETYHRKSIERLANHEPLLHMEDK